MADMSRLRITPYPKPLWHRGLIAALFLVFSLLLSQVILRDRAFMQTFIEAGQKVVEFIEVERAYRAAQAEGQTSDAFSGAHALASPSGADPDADQTGGVRVNRLAIPEQGVAEQGFKRVRVSPSE